MVADFRNVAENLYIGVSTVGCRGFSPRLVVSSITLKKSA